MTGEADMLSGPVDIVDIGEPLATASLAVARAFAAGATMWCIAPGRPEHARHVAVEFVHPVIVGKRALPAVSIDDVDLTAALRPLVRSGDVIVAIGPHDSAAICDVLRRAPAWGATTVWVGIGATVPAEPAVHAVHLGSDTAAWYDGRLVLAYHVLWELTHVCFEHDNVLAAAVPAVGVDLDDCDPFDDVCITCSDEGRVAEVVVSTADGSATVRTARGMEAVDTMLVGDVIPGDLLLVHAGTAITVLP